MIEEFSSVEHLADTAAGAVMQRLETALSFRGRASFIATGGRAPGPVYDRLGRARLDWASVAVGLSDERCVSWTSPASNARLVRERLLVGGAGRATFVPLWPQAADPAFAAELGAQIACDAGLVLRGLEPFDVVLLGMGEDGHVASLIPGWEGLPEAMDVAQPKLCMFVPAGHGSPPEPRITLTLAALAQARSILVVISGNRKRQVAEAALAGGPVPLGVLAQVAGPRVRILWSPGEP